MNHRAGFVNILGNPNVGKSTLMNVLMGEKISIITSKAQTTRHRILGILSGDDYQVVVSDTPGFLEPKYKLQDSMLGFVKTALSDADLFLYVTEVGETPGGNPAFTERIAAAGIPVLLIINKIDLTTQERLEALVAQWQALLPQAEIFPVSALKKFNTEPVFKRILALLPEGPAYYDKTEFTDKPERFFVSEILREKIFLNYQKEIPYCCEVVVESFKEEEHIIRIRAVILVARDTQKGILIGHRGAAMKKTASMARKEMEAFFAKKIFLETFVKVQKDWRDDEYQLRNLGYTQD
jgi:GTP-binding protein Era